MDVDGTQTERIQRGSKHCSWVNGVFISGLEVTFDIQTDTRNYQLRVGVSQEQKPVSPFLRKLADTKRRYKNTKK